MYMKYLLVGVMLALFFYGGYIVSTQHKTGQVSDQKILTPKGTLIPTITPIISPTIVIPTIVTISILQLVRFNLQ